MTVFLPESQVKIWLYNQATDMRKSFQGLSALVRHQLDKSPMDGSLFVFINKKCSHMKILYFDGSGYCIWMKRLEQGRFQRPQCSDNKMRIDWSTLKLILDGIDLNSIKKRKRFQLKNK